MYSGDLSSEEGFVIGNESGVASEKVLGLLYSPKTDSFCFIVPVPFKVFLNVMLNFWM